MSSTCDLKQIGEIYNESLQAIRSQPLEGFDNEVTAWLRTAQYEIMKDIEKNFYILEQSIHNPLLRPRWAINPESNHLKIFTCYHPPILDPYSEAIISNLEQFMGDCGLDATVMCIKGSGQSETFYSIKLHFQLSTIRKTPGSGILAVNDEFSSNPLQNIVESMRHLLVDRPDAGV